MSPPCLTRHYDSGWSERKAKSPATQMPLSRGFRSTQVLLSDPLYEESRQIDGIETRDSTCPSQGASLGPFMRLNTKGVTNTTTGILGLSQTRFWGTSYQNNNAGTQNSPSEPARNQGTSKGLMAGTPSRIQ